MNKRKPNRIPEYDYSQIGAYFITICSSDMSHIFGRIVGAATCRPYTLLSNTGKIIENEINQISNIYDCVSVDCYIIMPNHIHMIISIVDRRPQVAPTISRVIKQFKGKVTKLVGATCGRPLNTPIWQRSFHDHVIRNDRAYQKIWEYIENNPYTWVEDRYYTQEGN